jgi:hypothetical protein
VGPTVQVVGIIVVLLVATDTLVVVVVVGIVGASRASSTGETIGSSTTATGPTDIRVFLHVQKVVVVVVVVWDAFKPFVLHHRLGYFWILCFFFFFFFFFVVDIHDVFLVVVAVTRLSKGPKKNKSR